MRPQIIVALLAFGINSVGAHATACSSLAELKLPNTIVAAAQDIGIGKFVPAEGRPSDLQLTAYKG
jgi:hypothetical protein